MRDSRVYSSYRFQNHIRPLNWGISNGDATANQTNTPIEPTNNNHQSDVISFTGNISTISNGNVSTSQSPTEDPLPSGSAVNIARSTHCVTSTSGASSSDKQQYQKKQITPFTRYGLHPSNSTTTNVVDVARTGLSINVPNRTIGYHSLQFDPNSHTPHYLSSSCLSKPNSGSSSDGIKAPNSQYECNNQVATSLRSVNVLSPSGMSSDQMQSVTHMLFRTGSSRYNSAQRRSLESNLAMWKGDGSPLFDADSTITGGNIHGARLVHSSSSYVSSSVGDSYNDSAYSLSPLQRSQGEVQGRLRGIELLHHWLVLPESRANLQELIDDHLRMMEEGVGRTLVSPVARPSTPPTLVTSECVRDNINVMMCDEKPQESFSTGASDNSLIPDNITGFSTSAGDIDCTKVSPSGGSPSHITNNNINKRISHSTESDLLCVISSSNTSIGRTLQSSESGAIEENITSHKQSPISEQDQIIDEIDSVNLTRKLVDTSMKCLTQGKCSSLLGDEELRPILLNGNGHIPLRTLDVTPSFSSKKEEADIKTDKKEININNINNNNKDNEDVASGKMVPVSAKSIDITVKPTDQIRASDLLTSDSSLTTEKDRLKCSTSLVKSVLSTPDKMKPLLLTPCVQPATFNDIPCFYFPHGKLLKPSQGESIKDPVYNRHVNPHLKSFEGIALPGQHLGNVNILSNALGGENSCRDRVAWKKDAINGTNMLEHMQAIGDEFLSPGYKLAAMQTLSVVRDTDVLSSLTKILSKVPQVPVVSTTSSNRKVRVSSAYLRGPSTVLGKRPGSSSSGQAQYIAARAAYRDAVYAAVCKICTDVFGLPKYFATIVMRIIQKDNNLSNWSSSPIPQSQSHGKAQEGTNAPLPWTEGSPQALHVRRFLDFHDAYLKGKCTVRRIFDVLCACYTRKDINPIPESNSTTADHLLSCRTSAPDDVAVQSTAVDSARVLYKENFMPYLESLLELHPGLVFLKRTPDFQKKYVETILVRIFFDLDNHERGYLLWTDFERSKLVDALRQVDQTDDINTVLNYFSYEHFYVIYCRFWELDSDRDMLISREDLMGYFPNGTGNEKVVQRVFEGHGRRLANQPKPSQRRSIGARFRSGSGTRVGSSSKSASAKCMSDIKSRKSQYHEEIKMTYEDFVWFCLCEEDKSSARSIRYWFRILDLDGDGIISGYELEEFYNNTRACLLAMTAESITFEDIMCQISDMVPVFPGTAEKVDRVRMATIPDAKGSKWTGDKQKQDTLELLQIPITANQWGKYNDLSSVKCNDATAGVVSSAIGRWLCVSRLTGRGVSLVPNSGCNDNVLITGRGKARKSKKGSMIEEKHDTITNNSIGSLFSHESPRITRLPSDMDRYHRYGITLKDLLSRPSYAFVALNMILNVVKFLQFEQKDPFVSHQERLVGGYEGNEWDRFARAEYDRMSINESDE